MKKLIGLLVVGALTGSLSHVSPAYALGITNWSSSVGSLTPAAPGQTSPSCAAGTVTGATLCIGSYDLQKSNYNNDVTNGGIGDLATKLLATGVFDGLTKWQFGGKDDQTANTVVGALKFNAGGLNTTSGRITFGSPIDRARTALAISLKASTRFSIYYIPKGVGSLSSIDWNTLGVSVNDKGSDKGKSQGKGKGEAQGKEEAQALSHASVYYIQDATPVPTPALLPGLIGMGVVTFRKRKKAQAVG
ncbi:PTPA-CTERM sorting domain-containing protein [Leptolyngbya sp. AN03gr2]|uniref:PTPA-CTERM sorting domain-containing protein n=1 Tax=unclassified Leptolyngbya TaxID=2650499 RepID=UPI003D31C71A